MNLYGFVKEKKLSVTKKRIIIQIIFKTGKLKRIFISGIIHYK